MSVSERDRYVRWWLERSGLTADALRAIAAGIWIEDFAHDSTQRVPDLRPPR